jgi:hypothetical protein
MLMSTLKPALSGVEHSSGIHMKRCGVEGSSFSKYGQFNTHVRFSGVGNGDRFAPQSKFQFLSGPGK